MPNQRFQERHRSHGTPPSARTRASHISGLEEALYPVTLATACRKPSALSHRCTRFVAAGTSFTPRPAKSNRAR